MLKIIVDILTGIDNKTYDHGRVMGLLSFLSYFGLAGYTAVTGHPWGALDFASGASAMAVGFGINLKLKSETEPK